MRQRQDELSGSERVVDGLVSPGQDQVVATGDQAEVNRILVQSLELIACELEYLRTQAGLVEAWVREDTERNAQVQQALSDRLGQIEALLAETRSQVGALESTSTADKTPRRRRWPGFARLVLPWGRS